MAKDNDERSRPAGVAEYLFAELRQAVQDIRQKAVEEGWFGRVVTAAPVTEIDASRTAERAEIYGEDPRPLPGMDTGAERRPSFEELWAPREHTAPTDLSKPRDGLDFDR